MIIYNTTYQIDDSILDDTLLWFKTSLIPSLTCDGTLTNPRLLRVMVDQEEMGNCYSLQFNVSDEKELNEWYSRCGTEILNTITKRYQNRVLGFTTLLDNIEL
ncbi:MAG: DUF4286 family protein [Bacteroidales bacterium]